MKGKPEVIIYKKNTIPRFAYVTCPKHKNALLPLRRKEMAVMIEGIAYCDLCNKVYKIEVKEVV